MFRYAKVRVLVPAVLLCAALAFLAGAGCGGGSSSPSGSGPGPGPSADVLVLEYEEIDLVPGADKTVKVKSGKAESVEGPPKDAGVTAKLEGDKLTISAGKDAKEGPQTVTVKGGKKDATIKVNVKKMP
jgi:hypothetical protein